MKDPGNEDVLEDGAYENIKREAIILFHAKKASVNILRSLFLNR